MSDYIIDVKHLNCKIGHEYLLYDINWQVEPGEHWVVFGMNGSGKTSLLSVVAGYKDYTSGEVSLFGEKINDRNILTCRKKIGWVSSSFYDKYYTKESVLDIVLSGKSGTLGMDWLLGLEDTVLAGQLLKELKLADKMNYSFDMLSKGERQNVLIARALIAKPEILILDEPCTGLDIYNREYIMKTIYDLAKNLTIIYVTHYADEIMPIFKHCLLLKRGRVFAQGNIEDVFNSDMISNLLGYEAVIHELEEHTFGMQVLNVESNISAFLK